MPAHITLDAGATALLSSHGWPHADVVSVDRDSILFTTGLAPDRDPHTAWLHRHDDGRISVTVREGFDVTEPEDLHHGAGGPAVVNHGLAG
jgi:hypothetical protein